MVWLVCGPSPPRASPARIAALARAPLRLAKGSCAQPLVPGVFDDPRRSSGPGSEGLPPSKAFSGAVPPLGRAGRRARLKRA